jgi:hypothetical protein
VVSDVEKAHEMRQVVGDLAEPPRRLLLGTGAVDMALAAQVQRSVEAEQWGELCRSADFPGGN